MPVRRGEENLHPFFFHLRKKSAAILNMDIFNIYIYYIYNIYIYIYIIYIYIIYMNFIYPYTFFPLHFFLFTLEEEMYISYF